MSKTSFCIRRYTQKISQKRQADFVPKNNFFEFNFKFFQLISRIAIDTKSLSPPHICLYFYGLHWKRISLDTIYKTMGVETIHWRCIFYLNKQWSKLRDVKRSSTVLISILCLLLRNGKWKLKSDSHLPKNFFYLKEWWKMLFISI